MPMQVALHEQPVMHKEHLHGAVTPCDPTTISALDPLTHGAVLQPHRMMLVAMG